MTTEVERLVIHDDLTVADLIEHLQQYDPRQRFMAQTISPDGEAWNGPLTIFEIPGSNCGDGRQYIGLQIRHDEQSG